ncbi:MAG: RHS repeat-associated core domain-containing protein [Flavobacterium piscis]|nr:RHS repeat-associated core domain-containing protein [Flavobacterium piscis]
MKNELEPYGVLLEPQSEEDTNLRYKYTGQERDYSTGLDYMHFRFYASSMGRFLKPDNVIPNAFNPQSWNLYSYVIGNPVNFNDPMGHYCKAGSTSQVLFGQGGALGLSAAYGGIWENPQLQGPLSVSVDNISGYSTQKGIWAPIYNSTASISDSEVVWDENLQAWVGSEMTVSGEIIGWRWVEVGGESMVSNPEDEKGYIDFNISFAFEVPIGFTTGIMMNSASTHLYFGSGVVGPPGPSCSLTWSDNQITEGWNSAVQLQGGFAYQKGISQNLSTFTEKGMGYPYGISITTFYVSPPLPSPPAPTPGNRKFYMPW